MTDKAKKDTEAEAPVEEKKEDIKASETEEEAAPAPAAEEKKEAPADGAADAAASENEGAEVEIPKKFKDLVDMIENMSVLDLNELVKLLEKKFGVSAAAVAVAASGAAAGGDEGEQSSFTVELTAMGDGKVAVIKVVKEILGLGLKEAKDLVESAPAEIKKDVKKEEAEEIKAKLEEAGASVALK